MKILDYSQRFQDELLTIEQFGSEFLVCCPQCERRAKVFGMEGKVRFSCVHCGKNEIWRGSPGIYYSRKAPKRNLTDKKMAWIGAEHDWFFHYPLWLQVPACGHIFWAYNGGHLDYLEAYIAVGLRERRPNEYGWRNASYISRLPQWIKSANNRADLLHACQKLRELLIAIG